MKNCSQHFFRKTPGALLASLSAVWVILALTSGALLAQPEVELPGAEENAPLPEPNSFDDFQGLEQDDIIAPGEFDGEEEDLPPPIYDESEMMEGDGMLIPEPQLPPDLGRILQRQGGLLYPGDMGFGGAREGASIEEQQETIDKAVEDLKSDDPNIRQSAAMILGKYRLPNAREALLGALNDSANQVRQSALVALLEDPMQLGTREMINVLNMVDDPDVHIRRLATSAVAQWMPGGLLSSGPLGGSLQTSPFPPQLNKKILGAFVDEDLTVRRNIAAAYPSLRVDLGDDVYKNLLTDPDREIRMSMLQGLMDIYPQKLVQHAGVMLEDTDVTIRRELAGFLSSFMIPGVEQYLKQLAADEDFVVSQTANLALFQLNPTRKALEPLIEQINDQRTSQEMARRIVYSITSLDAKSTKEMLDSLLKDPQPKYLSEVLQLYSTLYRSEMNPEMVLPYAEDSSSEVRLAAMSALDRIRPQIREEHLERLLSSRFVDVRENVTALTRGLPPEIAEQILFELLLDQDDRVRISALREMAARRIPGWQDILARSLGDPNPELVQMAILLLSAQPEPSTVTILRQFAEETDDPKLRGLAIAQAQRIDRSLPSGKN